MTSMSGFGGVGVKVHDTQHEFKVRYYVELHRDHTMIWIATVVVRAWWRGASLSLSWSRRDASFGAGE